MKSQSIFITGTDTDVGKTYTTLVLASLLKHQGIHTGVFKPVQCGGDDAAFLKKHLELDDDLRTINPCFAREPLSPHLAFERQKTPVDLAAIDRAYEQLRDKYDVLLIEGAGGLMVPVNKDLMICDLIRRFQTDVVIVSRLGLGAINHSLLTINQVRQAGLKIRGLIFNQTEPGRRGIPEQTNPEAVAAYGQVKQLGTVPYLKDLKSTSIIKRCDGVIDTHLLLKSPSNPNTRRLTEWDKQYVWHPFTQMRDWLTDEPLIIDQARGSYLIDTDGRRYLDGVSSLWVNVHGHGKEHIDRAVKDQVDRLSHSTLLGLSNTPAVELAKKLIEIAPSGLSKVFYSDNGSSSVEIAIKMAYQYWQNIGQTQKTGIVHLANSYHGDTLGSVSVGGIDLFHKVYRNLIFPTIQIDFPDCYRLPEGKQYPDYAFEYVDRMEAYFRDHHQELAAMVIEPIVQGAAGMIIWPGGVLKRMEDICRRYDVLLIADEVATGFGRTGRMFACEHEEVSPDILCLAKGITGGYLPLAATLTSQRVYDGFVFDYADQKTFFHGHTYTGNPLCCAAAIASLEVFGKERVMAKLAPKIKYLSKHLQMFYNLDSVGDVRQLGMMAGIELVADRATREPYPWTEKIGVKICQEVRKHGVILRPLGNVIVIMPPLSITKAEIRTMLDATYKAIQAVVQGS